MPHAVAYYESCSIIRYKFPPLRGGHVVLEICPLAALPRGEALRVDTDPPIAVFHTDDGDVFAIDDTCTHQDASLADGWLEGCEIECPLHASRFNLRTGEADAPPAKLPVRTHQVTIVDGVINVRLDDAPPNLPPGVSTRAADTAAR
ncbi:bifunctional 3-phenylpropionate/cinnamic acid dioxygenase ferredoxin subunit [Mycolicibacterium moriokaense]|nr:bifunctional 3-phenylpropionate/cinnamic acid dioxygenase ferredoxin subunit [Mycolicibacterium moriokaense]